MLKKSVQKYLCGTKEEILARLSSVREIKLSECASFLTASSLRSLGVPDLPVDIDSFYTTEIIAENFPRARDDLISIMTIQSTDGSYVRSFVLSNTSASFGKLYGYLAEL